MFLEEGKLSKCCRGAVMHFGDWKEGDHIVIDAQIQYWHQWHMSTRRLSKVFLEWILMFFIPNWLMFWQFLSLCDIQQERHLTFMMPDTCLDLFTLLQKDRLVTPMSPIWCSFPDDFLTPALFTVRRFSKGSIGAVSQTGGKKSVFSR